MSVYFHCSAFFYLELRICSVLVTTCACEKRLPFHITVSLYSFSLLLSLYCVCMSAYPHCSALCSVLRVPASLNAFVAVHPHPHSISMHVKRGGLDRNLFLHRVGNLRSCCSSIQKKKEYICKENFCFFV